ncbi:hypothetical protein AMAG_09942 [Allomyces macrogynus ATCC 38327]|uniref:RRM domain-containing protein n=1 Tax=Allomyces macrogynus (strain ATCC 38327) TaxID=578462 RepID=A0A0L0SQD6_ALLM3|nr:hypothetical protein AMAG_09942 [Allomyces macrogynus ATCC 38327]|eukprot:KNE64584.1 hypothetical protein AMAG_09942 [Allomyces macrogynus ATCC 38327]
MSNSNARASGCMVFVGNIPWEATEDALADLFREPGPLAAFRLMIDKETLKPRGFGFAEYYDPATAASAVRNLHDYELHGRKLRVHLADAKEQNVEVEEEDDEEERERERREEKARQDAGKPMFTPLEPGVAAADAISKVIDGISKEQQLDLLANMKSLAATQPEAARALLAGNPQLTYSLMLMMLTCGIVDPSAIQRIVKNVAAAGPPPPGMMPPPPLMGTPPMVPPPVRFPLGAPPLVHPAAAAAAHMVPPMAMSAPPPVPAPPMVPPAAIPGVSETQRQLLVQVFALTPAQIDALAPEQRATVMQLRTQFAQFQHLFVPPAQ